MKFLKQPKLGSFYLDSGRIIIVHAPLNGLVQIYQIKINDIKYSWNDWQLEISRIRDAIFV